MLMCMCICMCMCKCVHVCECVLACGCGCVWPIEHVLLSTRGHAKWAIARFLWTLGPLLWTVQWCSMEHSICSPWVMLYGPPRICSKVDGTCSVVYRTCSIVYSRVQSRSGRSLEGVSSCFDSQVTVRSQSGHSQVNGQVTVRSRVLRAFCDF